MRMLIWTDMAPSFAKVVATVAAAGKGMNIGSLSGVVRDKEKAPWTVRSGARGGGDVFRRCA